MNLVSDIEVVLGGLIVVFSGMIAIVGLVYAISYILKRFTLSDEERAAAKAKAEAAKAERNAEKEAAKAAKAAEKAMAASSAKGDAAAVVSTENMTDDELVAVISAAVAAYLGGNSSGKAPRFRVTSFKRIGVTNRN